jgi:hypothetical protein
VVAETVEVGDTVLFIKASDAATEARAIRAGKAKAWRKMVVGIDTIGADLPFKPTDKVIGTAALAKHYHAVLTGSRKVHGTARWAIAAVLHRPSALAVAFWTQWDKDADKVAGERVKADGSWSHPTGAKALVGYGSIVAPSPESCAYVGAALGIGIRPDEPISVAIDKIVAWANSLSHVSNKIGDKAVAGSAERGITAYNAARAGKGKIAKQEVQTGKGIQKIGKESARLTPTQIAAGIARGKMIRANGRKGANRAIIGA